MPKSAGGGKKLAELDPVCGMTVNPSSAKGRAEHAGKTYYFCSKHCVHKFEQAPDQYLSKASAAGPELVQPGIPSPHVTAHLPAASAKVKDPVCGMDVDPTAAKHHFKHAGKDYYFCCGGCLEKFRVDPERYLSPKPAAGLMQLGAAAQAPLVPTATAPLSKENRPAAGSDQRTYVCAMCPEVRQTGFGPCPSCGMALEPEIPHALSKTEYTCPMHPEIVRQEPGSCPICGMALEPRTVTAHEEENPELVDMTRRFWVSFALTAPLLALVMADHLAKPALEALIAPRRAVWIQLILATPAVLWGGWPFFRRGWASLVNRRLNMFTLIALGTGVAYLYSLVAVLAPGIFAPSFRTPQGEVALYFEAAAVIVTLVLLGQVLELRARSQTGSAIRALLDLAPKQARLVRDDGSEEDVVLEAVVPGNRVRVRL